MHFVYDEAGKPMGEYTPDGTTIREYLWIGDTLVALRAGYAGHAFQYVLTDTFNLRYPGQYLDTETGLSCNYFRDYEPGMGRYVQSDPIGLPGGVSTFG